MGRGPVPCEKKHCDRDRLHFGGSLPISTSGGASVVVAACHDGECSERTIEVSAGETYGYDGIVLAPQCPVGWEALCSETDNWFLGVGIGFRAEDERPSHVEIRVTGPDDAILEEEFAVSPEQYVTVEPSQCDENPEDIVCLHFDATWDP